VGIGDTSGMVTDDSKTFRLDNLESEVDGGAALIVYFQQFRLSMYLLNVLLTVRLDTSVQ